MHILEQRFPNRTLGFEPPDMLCELQVNFAPRTYPIIAAFYLKGSRSDFGTCSWLASNGSVDTILLDDDAHDDNDAVARRTGA